MLNIYHLQLKKKKEQSELAKSSWRNQWFEISAFYTWIL